MPMANTSLRANRSSTSKEKQTAGPAPSLATRYGFPLADWLVAKDEARMTMVVACKPFGVITYTDLSAQIRSITISADDFRLRFLLEEISIEEDKAGRGLLSAVVVHAGENKLPGKGFFEMAARRGRDTSDPLTCWINELSFVHLKWQ